MFVTTWKRVLFATGGYISGSTQLVGFNRLNLLDLVIFRVTRLVLKY